MQVLLGCCNLSRLVCDVLAGIPTHEPPSYNTINGGGDGTAVAAVYKVLSLHGAPGVATPNGANDADGGAAGNTIGDLITHACLALAAVAQGLVSRGRRGASCILTTSQPKQRARLAALAHQASIESVPAGDFTKLFLISYLQMYRDMLISLFEISYSTCKYFDIFKIIPKTKHCLLLSCLTLEF